jgi:hydrogenase expression/formation protein HypC
MCLAVPARVIEVHDPNWATVEVGGASKRVSTDLIDGVAPGDYVLMHVGFAIQKLDESEARITIDLLDQMVEAQEERRG